MRLVLLCWLSWALARPHVSTPRLASLKEQSVIDEVNSVMEDAFDMVLDSEKRENDILNDIDQAFEQADETASVFKTALMTTKSTVDRWGKVVIGFICHGRSCYNCAALKAGAEEIANFLTQKFFFLSPAFEDVEHPVFSRSRIVSQLTLPLRRPKVRLSTRVQWQDIDFVKALEDEMLYWIVKAKEYDTIAKRLLHVRQGVKKSVQRSEEAEEGMGVAFKHSLTGSDLAIEAGDTIATVEKSFKDVLPKLKASVKEFFNKKNWGDMDDAELDKVVRKVTLSQNPLTGLGLKAREIRAILEAEANSLAAAGRVGAAAKIRIKIKYHLEKTALLPRRQVCAHNRKYVTAEEKQGKFTGRKGLARWLI